jgi:hypothetical protein
MFIELYTIALSLMHDQVANFFSGLGNSVYVGSGGGAFYQNYNFAVRTFSNSTTPFFSKRTWLGQGVCSCLHLLSELILAPPCPLAVTIDGLGIRGGPSRGNFTVSSQRHYLISSKFPHLSQGYQPTYPTGQGRHAVPLARPPEGARAH